MLVPQTEITINLDGLELVRLTLQPGGYVIGSDPASEIAVKAEGVSRYHAHLTITPDELRIQDLGSESGTFVSGVLAGETTRFWPNQKVLVGPAVLEARRLRTSSAEHSLPAPAVAVRRILPDEFLRGRKYGIAGTLGQGGMGAVLRAHEATTHRTVAMKVMLANISEADVVRFIAEAQITSQLEHPNIVPVHELGVDEHDQVFYTMKMVQGVNLREVLDKLRAGDAETTVTYSLRRLLVVLMRVSDAIAFAHSRSVIHRDLKPENVMIGDFGEVLVMDWGLAKVLGTPEGAVEAAVAGGEGSTVVSSARSVQGESFTRVGAFVGTPHYMSPEQARGETDSLDIRADVWALGGLLRCILSLGYPVEGSEADDIMANVRAGRLLPIPSERPHCPGGYVPESLAAVAEKAQAMDPAQRYASAAEFRHDIDAYLGGFATRAERAGAMRQIWLLMNRHRAVSAVLLVLLIVSLGFVVRLVASERRAEISAQIAKTNELFAKQKESVARQMRETAVREKESARQALARSRISLADAAYREANSGGMMTELNKVPEDLRDGEWQYLFSRADNSQCKIEMHNGAWYVGIAAHPTRPSVFAGAARGGEIVLFDAKTGKSLSSFMATEQQRKGTWFRSLDFSPDGERLAVGAMGTGGVAVYRMKDGQCLAQWSATGVDTVQFTEDGEQVLAMDDQTGLTMRDASTGEVRGSFRPCLRGALAPEGLAVVSQGNNLRVVDPVKHEVVRELYSGRDLITAITMPRGAKTLYFATMDGMVRGVNFADGKLVFEERLAERGGWLRVASTAQYVLASTAAGDRFRGVRAWDVATGRSLRPMLGALTSVEGLAIHPLSEEIIVSGVDSRVWSAGTRPPQWSFPSWSVGGVFWEDEFLPAGTPVRLEPRGQTSVPKHPWPPEAAGALAATTGGGTAAIARRVGSGTHAQIFFVKKKSPETVSTQSVTADREVHRLRLSAEGDRLALVDFYNGMLAWDTATGERLPKVDISGLYAVTDVAWLGPDRLAGITFEKERGAPDWKEHVALWDVKSGRRLQYVFNETAMDCLAASPDHRLLAEAGTNKYVRLRDPETLQVLREFRAHDAAVTALAFHPTKPILATTAADFTVRLWNLENLTMIETMRVPGREIATLQFNPSGDLLACRDVAQSVFVWDLRLPAADAREQDRRWAFVAGKTERANAAARLGQWAKARAEFTELLRPEIEENQPWFRMAPLLLQLGDHEAYRRHAHDLLERFGNSTDPLLMERTAKACLLEPGTGPDMQRAGQLGRDAAEKGKGSGYLPFFEFAKGLAQYRAGEFAPALETLQKFQHRPPQNTLDLHAQAVIAMALHRSGKMNEARSLLDSTAAAAAQKLPPDSADQTDSWHDILTVRLLLQEAASTLATK